MHGERDPLAPIACRSTFRLLSTLLLAELADADLAVAEGSPTAIDRLPSPYPEEEQAVARAVAKRQHEYRAARRLFREALAQLGAPPAPLPSAPDRSPVWPEGFIGSVTHTDGWCGVVLARAAALVGVGVDVEKAGPLGQEVARRVLTADEQSQLHPDEIPHVSKLYFSAKESVYKCQYPATGMFLDFHALSIDFDHPAQSFRVRFHIEVPGFSGGRGGGIEGRYKITSDYVATYAVRRRPG